MWKPGKLNPTKWYLSLILAIVFSIGGCTERPISRNDTVGKDTRGIVAGTWSLAYSLQGTEKVGRLTLKARGSSFEGTLNTGLSFDNLVGIGEVTGTLRGDSLILTRRQITAPYQTQMWSSLVNATAQTLHGTYTAANIVGTFTGTKDR